MSVSFPSSATQESYISASLNSTLMLTFSMGIYTSVYFVTRSHSWQRMIIATITAIYSDAVFQLGLQWYTSKQIFVTKGTTRGETFVALFESPEWLVGVSTLSQVLLVVLADVLLIWRCFFVWNRSVWAILVPAVLFVAELGISTALTFLSFETFNSVPTAQKIRLVEHIQVTFFCISFATSMAATLLIAFRIHSVSNMENTSRGRFQHVIDILVQSAAIYSVALLLQVAYNSRPTSLTDPVYFAFENYAASLAIVITGLVPTVMVARVCVAPNDNTDFPNLSHLQFRGQTISHEDGQAEIYGVREMDVDAILPPTAEKSRV
ncbi:hypothetical protein GALMADRAFT_160258 [Galerina marginata CBS 339.88]|uniref:Uncharacterized protein n=1 Tax=Galerina marginata (strain CBS 339.88) TaxID=685588 RepID=A0A067SFN5_GALM3|nr:hypothetical protein GALMADRAFT_160258 [Galerina marginata CBS 339.88]